MKNLQFSLYQYGVGWGWVEAGQVGSKKSKPIPAPLPLRNKENSGGAKRGGAGQAERGKIAIPR